MFTEIRIYYEGDALLKPGFSSFFSELRDRAKAKRCGFRLIQAKGTPCRDFGNAITANPTAWNILLKDSEGPDTGDLSASLCRENRWDASHADSIFWMVEMMEAWFHADKDALERFYGAGFRRRALKPNPQVEQILKKDLEAGLRAATKDTSKGDYFDNKTSHGPELLTRIDRDLVQRAAPNCQKLFKAVLARLEQT
jgi:hypothetical protein